MGQLEEDTLERWANNQLEDIKYRADQITGNIPSGNRTLGGIFITGFELLKLLMESQYVYERYRFMKRLQSMNEENIRE